MDMVIGIPPEGEFHVDEIQIVTDPNSNRKLYAGISISYSGVSYTENYIPTTVFSLANTGHSQNSKSLGLRIRGGGSLSLGIKNFTNSPEQNASVVVIGFFVNEKVR